MKFMLSLLIAAVFTPTLTMSAFVMEVTSATSASDACQNENEMIQEALYETLVGQVDNRRALSHTTTKSIWDYIAECKPGRCPDDIGFYCFWRCKDFAPGACWYLWPYRCADVRRGLLEGVTGTTIDDMVYEEVDSAHCTEASVVAEAKMNELAKVVESEECRAALMDDKKQYSCYDILGFK